MQECDGGCCVTPSPLLSCKCAGSLVDAALPLHGIVRNNTVYGSFLSSAARCCLFGLRSVGWCVPSSTGSRTRIVPKSLYRRIRSGFCLTEHKPSCDRLDELDTHSRRDVIVPTRRLDQSVTSPSYRKDVRFFLPRQENGHGES
jgi:hypothetical protein